MKIIIIFSFISTIFSQSHSHAHNNSNSQLYSSTFTKNHLLQLRNETSSLFNHAWNSYLEYGYPADEVTPQSCQPYGPDSNINNVVRNDALGNFSLMVLDNLDSFIIMNNTEKFNEMIEMVRGIDFNQDKVVQVFETTIRVLGGLLSAHLFATDLNKGFAITDYDGFLLDKAYDIGERLIPAFETKTGIPVPRINLQKGVIGVPSNLQLETCTAGATSPILEMTMLSKLTGDPRFETLTKNTYLRVWNARSDLDLVPMTIDPISGNWKDAVTGIGASIDSFYEYSLKTSILFNDAELKHIWDSSYKALSIHSKSNWYFNNVDSVTGFTVSSWIDSLGAFFPGLQVLAGLIDDSLHTHALYFKIWSVFESIPERWNFLSTTRGEVELEWYPLRPEFIESTYYLYRATRDPIFLQIGQRILKDLKEVYWEPCGFSGYSDIRTGEKQDRMESFVLSETLKYLYLLFDEDNFLHSIDDNIIFSTEGHPLWYNKGMNPKYNSTLKDYSDFKPGKVSEPVAQDQSILKRIGAKQIIRDLMQTLSFKEITLSENMELFEHDQNILFNKQSERVAMGKLNDSFLRLESDIYGLQTCQVSPLKNGFFSNYMNWGEFTMIDKRYQKTLIKPKHLVKSNRNPQHIELENGFYDRYTGPSQTCPRYPTTDGYELLLGTKEEIRYTQVDKVMIDNTKLEQYKNKLDKNELVVWPDDYWIPLFSNLRINIEKLRTGQLDSYNDLLSEEYIQDIRHDDYNNEGVCNVTNVQDVDLVLRIKSINGLELNKGQVIWTLPFNMDTVEVGVTSHGRVKLNGNPIENLHVWYG